MAGQLNAPPISVAEPDTPAGSSPRRARRKWNFAGLAFIVVVVAVWELLVDTGVLAPSVLPSPGSILQATGSLIQSGVGPQAVGHTLGVTLAGWAIGAVVGAGLGVWLGMAITAWRYSAASIEVLRAIPPIAFVPLLLLLLGFSVKSEIALSGYAATFPILIYTVAGVRSYTAMHADVTKVLHLSNRAKVIKIIMPTALSHMIVGMRIGLQFALGLTIVSEMTGNPAGLGYQIAFQQQALNLPKLYAYVLATGLIGWLLNSGLLVLLRAVVPNLMRTSEEG